MESENLVAKAETTILLVDNDRTICNVLKTRLTNLGYIVFVVKDGNSAIPYYRRINPALVILDIVLPKLDGFEVCAELRKESQVPIIILTALGSLSERVMGLELGADDYITKPFNTKELEARIRAVLRRYSAQPTLPTSNTSSLIQTGPLRFDIMRRQVSRGHKTVNLTVTEFKLLDLLVANAGTPLSRPHILDNVWGYTPERYVDNRVVDVHIFRLRAKLEEDPSNPDFILTARGKGYMFPKYKT